MAEGFKIADAFVEIHAEIDRDRLQRASRDVGDQVSKGVGDGVRNRRKGVTDSLTDVLSGVGGAVGKVGAGLGRLLTHKMTDIAPGLASGVTGALSNPYVLGAVAAAAVAMGSVLVSALGGALLAGLGSGVVAAGIALALRDPAIKAEISVLGRNLLDGLTQAASGFVTPVRDAVRLVRSEFARMLPDLAGMFGAAGKLVRPLVESLLGLVREMLPGFREALENMGPVFDMLARELPNLGAAIGDFFSSISENSEALGQALRLVLWTVGRMLDLMAVSINSLSFLFDNTIGAAMRLGDSLDPPEMKMRKLDRATVDLTRDTTEAARETGSLVDAIKRLTDTTSNAIDAEGSYQDSVDNVTAAIKAHHAVLVMENGVLVQNTEKQRIGAQAINDVAKAAKARAEAEYQSALQTGTQTQADAAARASMIKSKAELIKLAQKLGLSADEAKRLADNLLTIPAKVTTTVGVRYVQYSGGKQLADDVPKRGHATGGLVRGPGTGTSDDVPINASDGEYVLRAAAVKKIGLAALEKANRDGRLPTAAAQTASTSVMERPAPAVPPIVINMAGANFYGVGTQREYVAGLFDELDRYQRGYSR